MAWTPGRRPYTPGRTGHTGTSSGHRCTPGSPWDEKATGERERRKQKDRDVINVEN